MQRRCILILLLAVFSCAFLPLDTHADGNKLLDQCLMAERYLNKSDDFNADAQNSFKIGVCLGLVQGVRNTMFTYEQSPDAPKMVCFPGNGIKNDQALRIAVKYLKTHPEELHEYESLLLMKSFMDAHPCK